MSYSAWAEQTARKLLQDPLPRRWAHARAGRHRLSASAIKGKMLALDSSFNERD
ncbi:MAG TPA: hypothetical protein VK586_11645 [Streptosporangiaceae bacterium]|nr:hypothetical protein [Streptosporangiaceae bacterium]